MSNNVITFDKPTFIPTTEGPKQVTQIIMPNKVKAISKPKNFEKALQRMKETGKIDPNDFNNAADIGAFIDFYNDGVRNKKKAHLDGEVTEISKLLVKLMTTKTFLPNKPKVIKQKDVQPVVDSPKKG